MATAQLDRHLLVLAVMVWASLAVVVAIVVGLMLDPPQRPGRPRSGSLWS
jgi:hypothetical protein